MAAKRTQIKKAPAKSTKPSAKKVRPIPRGMEAISPFLIVESAAAAIAFYKKAFGATLRMRMDVPGGSGKVFHAEMDIGGTVIMLCDEFPDMKAWATKHYGGSPITLYLYVEDADKFAARAVKAGAKLTRPVAQQFYGDRNGSLTDPFGHVWHIATHMEDVRKL